MVFASDYFEHKQGLEERVDHLEDLDKNRWAYCNYLEKRIVVLERRVAVLINSNINFTGIIDSLVRRLATVTDNTLKSFIALNK